MIIIVTHHDLRSTCRQLPLDGLRQSHFVSSDALAWDVANIVLYYDGEKFWPIRDRFATYRNVHPTWEDLALYIHQEAKTYAKATD